MMIIENGMISDNNRPRSLNNMTDYYCNLHRVTHRTRRVSFRLDHTSWCSADQKRDFDASSLPAPSSPRIEPLLPVMESMPSTLLPPCVPKHFSSFVAPPIPLPLPAIEPAKKNCNSVLLAPFAAAVNNAKNPQERKKTDAFNHTLMMDHLHNNNNNCYRKGLVSSEASSMPVTQKVTHEKALSSPTPELLPQNLQHQQAPPPPKPEMKIEIATSSPKGVEAEIQLRDDGPRPRPVPRRRSVPRLPTDLSVFPPQFKRDSNLPERSSHHPDDDDSGLCAGPSFHHRRRRHSAPSSSKQQQLVVVPTWNEDLEDLRNRLLQVQQTEHQHKKKQQQQQGNNARITTFDDSTTTASEMASFADNDNDDDGHNNSAAGNDDEDEADLVTDHWLKGSTKKEELESSVRLLQQLHTSTSSSVERVPQVCVVGDITSSSTDTQVGLLECGMMLHRKKKTDIRRQVKNPAVGIPPLLQRKNGSTTTATLVGTTNDDQSKLSMMMECSTNDQRTTTTTTNDEESTLMRRVLAQARHTPFIVPPLSSQRIQFLLPSLMMIGMVLRMLFF